jgi:hypothetical protein
MFFTHGIRVQLLIQGSIKKRGVILSWKAMNSILVQGDASRGSDHEEPLRVKYKRDWQALKERRGIGLDPVYQSCMQVNGSKHGRPETTSRDSISA